MILNAILYAIQNCLAIRGYKLKYDSSIAMHWSQVTKHNLSTYDEKHASLCTTCDMKPNQFESKNVIMSVSFHKHLYVHVVPSKVQFVSVVKGSNRG